MADAHESLREQMQQEAAQEFIERERQQLLLVVVSGITPAKSDLAIRQGNQAMVGDRYAMRVTTEIAQHIRRASKRRFRIDHPILSEQRSHPRRKSLRVGEDLQISVKVKPAVVKGTLERCVELAAKDATENFDGEKEIIVWFDPTSVIGR